jgi:DHA1 family bicyclomycin/chloramphenicol resistance-like MFS transporter
MPSFLERPLIGRTSAPSLALLVIITMTGTMAMHIFVPALPDAAAALHATPFAVQLTITLYLCGLAGGQLVCGPLSDRFGRRPVLVVSLALYLLGLLVAIPAESITTLVIARVLQSLGGCGSLVLGRAMVRDVSTAEDANRKIAVLTIVMALTPALAPAIGGLINTWLGWRAIFACLGGLVAALFAVVLFTLPETNSNPIPLPGVGAVLSGYLRLIRSTKYRNFLIAGSCCGTSLYAFLAVAPFLLVDVLGVKLDYVGLYCLVVVGGMVVGSFVARQVSGRMEIRKAARRGNVVSLVSALALLAIDLSGHLSTVTLLVPLTIYSAGVGIASPNAVAGLMNVDPRAAGSASSLYGFSQMAFGAVFTLAVALWHSGSAIAVAATLLAAAFIAMVSLSRV